MNDQVLICEDLRKSAVKCLLLFRSPVVSGPAIAVYCQLPAVFIALRLALCREELIICENRRESAVK